VLDEERAAGGQLAHEELVVVRKRKRLGGVLEHGGRDGLRPGRRGKRVAELRMEGAGWSIFILRDRGRG